VGRRLVELGWASKVNLMETNSLLGIWTGTAHNINGWDMKITLTILQPFEVGSTLGIFHIPMIPCSGTFKVLGILGETIKLKAENIQGDCREADSDTLELLDDGTLLYISKGDGWETRGILERAS
jgi:hypothetical protein